MKSANQNLSRLTLFSSYFETGLMPKYIRYYLEYLRPHSTTLIYITTDDKKLSSEDIEWLNTHTDEFLQVKNEGFDFGMWQKALNKYNAFEYDELCLANDSCVCFSDLNQYFEWHNTTIAEMTSMTSSNQVAFHLQSFFLTIKKSILHSVVSYIKEISITDSTILEVIAKGEVGLSQYLIKENIKIEGWYTCSPSDMGNPTFAHAVDLINFGVPLVKRKIFSRYNSPLLKNQLVNTGSWQFSSVINIIKTRANLSDKSTQELFEWYDPKKISLLDKIRIWRWVLKYKLGLLDK